MGIFADYISKLRDKNDNYRDVTLFEMLSSSREKRPFDKKNLESVMNSFSDDQKAAFTAQHENNKTVFATNLSASINSLKLPPSDKKIREMSAIYATVANPIIEDIAGAMRAELKNKGLPIDEKEINKRAFEAALNYVFDLQAPHSLGQDKYKMLAAREIARVFNDPDPVKAYQAGCEKTVAAAVSFDKTEGIMWPTDAKAELCENLYGMEKYTAACMTVLPQKLAGQSIPYEAIKIASLTKSAKKYEDIYKTATDAYRDTVPSLKTSSSIQSQTPKPAQPPQTSPSMKPSPKSTLSPNKLMQSTKAVFQKIIKQPLIRHVHQAVKDRRVKAQPSEKQVTTWQTATPSRRQEYQSDIKKATEQSEHPLPSIKKRR